MGTTSLGSAKSTCASRAREGHNSLALDGVDAGPGGGVVDDGQELGPALLIFGIQPAFGRDHQRPAVHNDGIEALALDEGIALGGRHAVVVVV